MTNTVYDLYKQSLLAGDTNADLDNDTTTDGPFCALSNTAGNTAHQFYSSLTGLVGTDQRIATPTVALGVFDGSDLTYTAVSGSVVNVLIIYRKNSGANTTWRLVCFIDSSVTGLPVTPNGGNITVTWNASGIFKL